MYRIDLGLETFSSWCFSFLKYFCHEILVSDYNRTMISFIEFFHSWVKINFCLKVLYSFFRPNTWGPGMFRRPKNFWSRTKIILTLHFYGRFNKLKKYIGMKSCIKSHETVNFKSDYMKVLTLLWNIQRATSPRKSSQLYVQCNFTPFFLLFFSHFWWFLFLVEWSFWSI